MKRWWMMWEFVTGSTVRRLTIAVEGREVSRIMSLPVSPEREPKTNVQTFAREEDAEAFWRALCKGVPASYRLVGSFPSEDSSEGTRQ